MKCPYRKNIRTYPDGKLAKIIEEDFLDCIENSCPYWGTVNTQKIHRQEGGRSTLTVVGCRKVEKECQ